MASIQVIELWPEQKQENDLEEDTEMHLNMGDDTVKK